MQGLLLDVGGVVIRTPFELLDPTERRLGLPAGRLGPRGVFDQNGDPDFDRVLDGSLAERAYWSARATQAAESLAIAPQPGAFIRLLFDLPENRIVRREVDALIGEAADAGIKVGLLTNDVRDFHGVGWLEGLPFYRHVDAVVDGSVTGVLKPDPSAYRLGIEAMGLPADSIVYVDDQPVNVAGGRAAGLHTIAFDVTDPVSSVQEIRNALDLPCPAPNRRPPSRPGDTLTR